jgi:hypothetical protein
MRAVFVSEMKMSLRAYGVIHVSPGRVPNEPRPAFPFDLSDPEVQRRIKRVEAREWFVATLNLPGGLPDLVYSMVSPAHSGWTPAGMFMWSWRDISWPIIGMFFWWLAGRSAEALLFARRGVVRPKIRWWEVLLSLPVLGYGALWAIGMCIDPSARAEFTFWPMLAILGAMWFVLGLFAIAAKIVQWRLGRRTASGPVAEAAETGSGG